MSDLSGPVGDLPAEWIEAATDAASRQHFEGFRAAQRAVGIADPVPYDELSERSRHIRGNQVRGLVTAALADVVPLIRAHIADEIAAEQGTAIKSAHFALIVAEDIARGNRTITALGAAGVGEQQGGPHG